MATAADATPSQKQTLRISPTMLIGLGGTGKDVLLRIRRMFFERFGRKADGTLGFPIIGYLALDTDPGALERLERDGLSEYVLRNILFKRGGTPEALDCSVEPRQLEEYFRRGNSANPHIFRWLDPDLKRFGANAIVGGAGQNRQFGRLAFFHHFTRIRDTLKARIKQIVDDATLPNRKEQWVREARDDVQVNAQRLEVVLVYSLAGGTGAGMFLDVGFLARYLVEQELKLPGIQPFFTHLVLLPESFVQPPAEGERHLVLKPDQCKKIQANAFACLREMEYFSMPPSQAFDLSIPPPVPAVAAGPATARPWYAVQWELDREPYEVHSSPWDTCYLVGGGNDRMGKKSLAHHELYQMMAERLFLHFYGGQFASTKQTTQSNEQDEMLQELVDDIRDEKGNVLYRHFVSKRFSTFGLAQVHFDRERMRRAASYRLAYLLVTEWWLRDLKVAPTEQARRAREDLLGGAGGKAQVVTETGLDGDHLLPLTYDAVRDRVLLVDRDADRTRTWFKVLEEEEEARRRQIEDGVFDGGSDEPITPFLQAQLLRLSRQPAKAGETGLALRTFARHRELLEPEIDRRLRALFQYRLQELGVPAARQLLDEYAKLTEAELLKAQENERKKPGGLNPNWSDRLRDARRLPLRSVARRAGRLELLRSIRQARNYLVTSYHREAVPDIRVCLELAHRRVAGKRDGSYASVLRRFQDVLEAKTDQVEGVRHFLARRFEELRRQDVPEGRISALLTQLSDQDYDQRIAQLVAPQGRGPVLDMTALGPRVEQLVLEQLRASNPQWDRLQTVGDVVLALAPLEGTELPAQPVLDEFARALAEACEGLLSGFAEDTTALEQFNRDIDEQRVRLDCLRTYSAPYLRLRSDLAAATVDTEATKRLGIANSKGAAAEVFSRQVESGGAGHQLVGLQTFDLSDDSLMLYQEKTGIPLCYYQELEALAGLYGKALRLKETHFDYPALRGRLPEIRKVSSANQRRLAECLELSLSAIIARRLRWERRKERARTDAGHDNDFLYYLTDEEFSFPLGDKLEDVVHHLANPDNEKDRTELERQVERWLLAARGKQEGQLLVLLWCALQDLHQELLHRLQHQINQEQVASAEARNHPVLEVVGQRMLARVRVQIEGLARGREWLDSCLDRQEVVRKATGEERQHLLKKRAELLRGCFEAASGEQAIPVIVEGARLDLRFFGNASNGKDGAEAAPGGDVPHRPRPVHAGRGEDGAGAN
jgi:hypothetical protein